MDGGSGNDTVAYRNNANAAIQASLESGTVAGGFNTGGTLISIENLVGTLVLGDRLTGNGVANRLEGLGGNDILEGKGGSDVLVGDAEFALANDGADIFRYFAPSDSAAGTGRDRILDFEHNVDRIDLGAIDAKAGTAGNQAFGFIGKAAFTAQGQVRFFVEGDHTVVQLNTAGTSGAESEIELAGIVTLTGVDFIL